MTQLVRLNATAITPDSAKQGTIAIFLNGLEVFTQAVNSLLELHDEIYTLSLGEERELVHQKRGWLPSRARCNSALNRLDDALAKLARLDVSEASVKPVAERLESALATADPSTISKWIIFMLEAKPASSSPNPAGFAKVLAAEVIATSPSFIALLCTCRVFWRSGDRFAPSIGEVLAELENQQRGWEGYFEKVAGLKEYKAKAIAALTDNRAQVLELLRRRRELEPSRQESACAARDYAILAAQQRYAAPR